MSMPVYLQARLLSARDSGSGALAASASSIAVSRSASPRGSPRSPRAVPTVASASARIASRPSSAAIRSASVARLDRIAPAAAEHLEPGGLRERLRVRGEGGRPCTSSTARRRARRAGRRPCRTRSGRGRTRPPLPSPDRPLPPAARMPRQGTTRPRGPQGSRVRYPGRREAVRVRRRPQARERGGRTLPPPHTR